MSVLTPEFRSDLIAGHKQYVRYLQGFAFREPPPPRDRPRPRRSAFPNGQSLLCPPPCGAEVRGSVGGFCAINQSWTGALRCRGSIRRLARPGCNSRKLGPMERLATVGDRIDSVTLSDVDGKPVELAGLLDRPTVIPLVRYYGCMPCQAYLRDLEGVRPQVEDKGLRVIGVGGAADFQARHLMDNGVGFPLMLDPKHRLYEALNIHRIPWSTMASPFTWKRYLSSAKKARQGRITDHPLQAPGLAILDTDGTLRFLHRGRTLGDYPTIPELLSVIQNLA